MGVPGHGGEGLSAYVGLGENDTQYLRHVSSDHGTFESRSSRPSDLYVMFVAN